LIRTSTRAGQVVQLGERCVEEQQLQHLLAEPFLSVPIERDEAVDACGVEPPRGARREPRADAV